MENIEQKNYSFTYLMRRFSPYIGKYYHILALDLLCAGFSTICDLYLPMLLRKLTTTAQNDLSQITFKFIAKLGALYLVLRLIDIIASFITQSIGHIMGAKIETDMRQDVFNHLQTLPFSFYNTTKSGHILTRITTDLFDVTEFSHHCPEEFFIGGVKLIISFIILIRINIPLTLILYSIIPIMIWFLSIYNKKMKDSQRQQRSKTGDINSVIEGNILGARVVKSFANEDVEMEKFSEENKKFLSIKKKFYLSLASMSGIQRIFDGILYLIVIIYGGYLMTKGEIKPADMFVYTMYVGLLLSTVKRVVDFMDLFQRGVTGIERFITLMDVKNNIVDKDDAIVLDKVKGDIKFDNVSFAYDDGDEEVFSNINFSISSGDSVALVGSSGVGKTTLCNLIPRFYDVTEGAIYLDGVNIKDIQQKSLRDKIGVVQQDVYLFSGTIYDNIIYGKKDATMDEVVQAAKMSGAYEFISKLEDGFNTNIGQRGLKLSGGQKQRISIARVFLKNPPILILDEATSALDNKSETIVQNSLEKLAKGRTTITIAHRLSTIKNAKYIIVLTEEGISEIGNHDQLMAKKGTYYSLYTRDFSTKAYV